MQNSSAHEESEFCKVANRDCYGHYLKDYNSQMRFQDVSIPLSSAVTDRANDWLEQHIKNMDQAHRKKLKHNQVPGSDKRDAIVSRRT